jgi:hypothetical protein
MNILNYLHNYFYPVEGRDILQSYAHDAILIFIKKKVKHKTNNKKKSKINKK